MILRDDIYAQKQSWEHQAGPKAPGVSDLMAWRDVVEAPGLTEAQIRESDKRFHEYLSARMKREKISQLRMKRGAQR